MSHISNAQAKTSVTVFLVYFPFPVPMDRDPEECEHVWGGSAIDTRGDLDLGIEHAEDVLQLRILDDCIGTVTASTPQRKKEAHTWRGVGDAVSKCLDLLAFGSVVGLAGVDMALEVTSRVLVISTIDMLGWAPDEVISTRGLL